RAGERRPFLTILHPFTIGICHVPLLCAPRVSAVSFCCFQCSRFKVRASDFRLHSSFVIRHSSFSFLPPPAAAPPALPFLLCAFAFKFILVVAPLRCAFAFNSFSA